MGLKINASSQQTVTNPIQKACKHAKTATRKAVEGAAFTVETTEGFKKIWQVIRGIIEVIGLFTSVQAFSPIVNAVKVVGITISGFDFVGRIKEWVVPSKGETLIQKHWTKIISRIHLAFANFIDLLKMLQFFKIFSLLKLGVVAASMRKIPFFKIVFDHFPGLDVIKHPFIGFASLWSIFDTSLTIHRKQRELKHIRHKIKNWDNLSYRGYQRNITFIDSKIAKYTNRISNPPVKLNKAQKAKIEKAKTKLPQYRRFVAAMRNDTSGDGLDNVQKFAENKANKWQDKAKNIKIDFAKSGFSISTEVLKIAVVSLALILSLTVVGWSFLPATLVVLGLISNGCSLAKFLVDKLVIPKTPTPVYIPKRV